MEELVCQITGKVLDVQNALEYKINGLSRYVDPAAVLELVQNSALLNVILERVALNQTTFNEILSIRKQAAALEKGKQDGANLALEALRRTAKESGVEPSVLEDLILKTFNKTEEVKMQAVQDNTTEADSSPLENGNQDEFDFTLENFRKNAKELGIEPSVLEDLILKTCQQAMEDVLAERDIEEC